MSYVIMQQLKDTKAYFYEDRLPPAGYGRFVDNGEGNIQHPKVYTVETLREVEALINELSQHYPGIIWSVLQPYRVYQRELGPLTVSEYSDKGLMPIT